MRAAWVLLLRLRESPVVAAVLPALVGVVVDVEASEALLAAGAERLGLDDGRVGLGQRLGHGHVLLFALATS